MTINRPEIENTNDPHPLGPLSGDYTDDDGRAIDDYFESADHNPVKETGLPKDQVRDQKDIPVADRLISRTLPLVSLAAAGDVIQFFSADLNRKKLIIYVEAAASHIRVGSQKTDVYGAGLLGGVATGVANGGGNIYDFGPYTGAVWIGADDFSGNVTAYCVTV